jgi:Zn-finger nucleic acid-binding protein
VFPLADYEESDFQVRSERICPRCHIDLYLIERGGENLDICRKCGGIWFDPNELDDLMGKGSPVELLIRITDSLKGEDLLCPECEKKMTTKEIYDVYVDLCEDCKGIWMDLGETEKVWEMDERSKHPFDMQPGKIDPSHFWDHFRNKYSGFDTSSEKD